VTVKQQLPGRFPPDCHYAKPGQPNKGTKQIKSDQRRTDLSAESHDNMIQHQGKKVKRGDRGM